MYHYRLTVLCRAIRVHFTPSIARTQARVRDEEEDSDLHHYGSDMEEHGGHVVAPFCAPATEYLPLSSSSPAVTWTCRIATGGASSMCTPKILIPHPISYFLR